MKPLLLASGILGGTLALGIASWMIWHLQEPETTGLAREHVVVIGPKTRAAIMDAVDRYLETTDPKREKPQILAVLKPELKPRTFCHEELVEIRQKNADRQLVALAAACEEYARSGGRLLASSQYKNLALLTVDTTDGRYQVLEIQEALEGDLLRSSVREMFSAEGAPRALEISDAGFAVLSEQNRAEGRKAFGLPPNAEIKVYQPG